MQVKDIPDMPILEFLENRLNNEENVWACSFEGFENSVQQAMPPGIPWKLVRAKMCSLIRKGLVSGCSSMHNCRGDYELTSKGQAVLDLHRAARAS